VISDRNGRKTSVGIGGGSGEWLVPSLTTNHCAKVVASRTVTGGKARNVVTVTFHSSQGNLLPKATTLSDLADDTGGGLDDRFGRLPQPLDQHLFLVPEAKVLAVLNHDRTKITLRKVEVR
jgi:hypothetical protein